MGDQAGGAAVQTIARPREKSEMIPHIPELDGVRGIAVLGVMLLHFYDPVAPQNPLGPLSLVIQNGVAGVDLFFVLSGFLITSILVSTKSSLNYFSAFYARRALRIFPLYFLVVALFFDVFVPLLQHKYHKELWIQPREQIWYWLFLQNWRLLLIHNGGAQLAHFWSLAIEEQFYLVWSIAVWFLSLRHLRIATVVLIATILISKVLMSAFSSADQFFISLSTFTRMDTLLFGALLAICPGFRKLCARYSFAIVSVAVVAALWPCPLVLKLLIYAAGSTGLVALATTGRVPALRAGWLRMLGKYSYGLYIIHYLVHGVLVGFLKRFNPFAFAVFSITFGIGISCVLAVCSWKLIEAPFMRLKSRFKYRFPVAS